MASNRTSMTPLPVDFRLGSESNSFSFYDSSDTELTESCPTWVSPLSRPPCLAFEAKPVPYYYSNVRPVPEEAVEKKKEGKRHKACRWIRSPLKEFYSYQGRKQVLHYVDRYSPELINEDGTPDEKMQKAFHQAMDERLIEKTHHYDEEGRKYLKIYAGVVCFVIFIIAGGTIVSSTVASGGAATVPAVAVGASAAVTFAVVGAAVTAGLFAYRVNAKRKHVLKGTANVYLARYHRDQQHARERACADLMAQVAFSHAAESHLGSNAAQASMSPEKLESVCEVIVESMIANEAKSAHLKYWTGLLQSRTEEALESPPLELAALLEDVAILELSESLVRAARYETAKAWLAPQVLEKAVLPMAEILAPCMYPDSHQPFHLHLRSSRAITELVALLGGVARSQEASIRRLERKNAQVSRANRVLRSELNTVKQEISEMRAWINSQQSA